MQAMHACASAVAGRVSSIVQEAGPGASSSMAVGLDLTAAKLCRIVCAVFMPDRF